MYKKKIFKIPDRALYQRIKRIIRTKISDKILNKNLTSYKFRYVCVTSRLERRRIKSFKSKFSNGDGQLLLNKQRNTFTIYIL